MADILENAWNGIVNGINKAIEYAEETQGYQSPLETMGIAMRDTMRPIQYYNKKYEYAIPVASDEIRTNSAYVSVSGWRPSTMDLNLDIHDKEWDTISSEFTVQ